MGQPGTCQKTFSSSYNVATIFRNPSHAESVVFSKPFPHYGTCTVMLSVL
jgi:hypothetical protein